MDEMKPSLLKFKVKAIFLVAIKTNIDIQINMVPMAINYASALINYRNREN